MATELTPERAQFIRDLIVAIDTATTPESVTNEMVAAVLDWLDKNHVALDSKIDSIAAAISAVVAQLATRFDGIDDRFDAEAAARAAADSDLSASIDNINIPVEAVETELGELVLADADGTPLLTVADGHVKTANFDSSDIDTDLPIEVEDTDLGELVLADADGTPIMTVTEDGHIRTAAFDSSSIQADNGHPVEAVETDLGELVLADADGTPMIWLTDEGYLRTPKFNSADLPSTATLATLSRLTQRLGKFAGKRLSIIGDSISAYPGAVAPGYTGGTGGDLTAATDLWWSLLASDLSLTVLRNCSQSGTTVTGDSASTADHSAGCSTKRVNDLGDGSATPDIVIILMGVNDWMRGVALGECPTYSDIPEDGTITDFSKAYALMLSKVMTRYPAATVYCMTPTEVGPYVRGDGSGQTVGVTNANGATVHQFGLRIAQIAAMMGARVIDNHSCGITYANHQAYTFDHLHPNRAGYRLMYANAKNALINTY